MPTLLIISNTPERIEGLRYASGPFRHVEIAPADRLPPVRPGQIVLCDFDDQGSPSLRELEKVLPSYPPARVVAGVTQEYFWTHPEALIQPVQVVLIRPYDLETLRRATESSIPWNVRPTAASRDMIGVLIEATTSVIGQYDDATRLCGVWAMNRLSPHVQVGGAMPLTGDLRAEAVLAMNETTAKRFSARLVGCSPADLNSADAHDGVGEIVNQICGHGMTMLSRRRRHIRIALPKLFAAGNIPEELQHCVSFLTLLFRSSDGYFTFQLGFPVVADTPAVV